MTTGVRVAVTGVGLVTPWGVTRSASWAGILSGRSATRRLRWTELSNRPQPAQWKSWEPWVGAPVPLKPVHGRQALFADIAVREAVQQAELNAGRLQRAGVVIGTSKIEFRLLDDFGHIPEGSPGDAISRLFPSECCSQIAAEWGCQGPILTPVAACATGLVSIIRGAQLIQSGECRTVLAGSADASLHPALLAAYRRLGVLAKVSNESTDAAARACRPFDRHRSGFVPGEGAAILVLENWEQARSRGATILAEYVDGHFASDPGGLTKLDTTGATLAENINRLLRRNGIDAAEIDGVSLHGTATLDNDQAESAALRRVFGDPRRVPAFALKGSIGHLMGAAGAVESAACVLSLAEQVLPPSANSLTPDPESPMRLSAEADASWSGNTLLKISLGFGGPLAVALFRGEEVT